MIYQEQLMRVAQRLAGYSLEEADNLRKATGKKIRALIAKERTKFVDGCVASGHSTEFAESIFDTIEPFADYSFNKSHSFGYGYVTYQTAWLKANHPPEYLAALLTSVKTNKDQTAVFLNECRQMGIEVLVPDVNESVSDFSVRAHADGGSAIRFGLSAVRNVGEGVVAHIVAAREEGGPFTDFYDFCDRVDPSVLNKRRIESLAKAGAFDSVGHPRQGLVFVHETIIETVLGRRRNEAEGQFDLFSAVDDPAPESVVGHRTEIPDTEFPKSQRLAFEKEMLGLYVSDHPMMGAERALRKYIDCTLSRAARRPGGRDEDGRRHRHRAQPSLHEARRPHGDVRARGPRRRTRGDGLPEDDGAVRPPARGRRHRGGEGPPRRARRHAQDHRHGGHPTRARRSTPGRRCG